jgi:glycosyltransferase involved in cell wall biosynthesis
MKILYIYDFIDWAIHNVGKLWFDGLPDVETTYIHIKELPHARFDSYDIIWYGFMGMFYRQPAPSGTPHLLANLIQRIPPLKNIAAIKKSVIAIHDPSELFPLIPKWQESPYCRLASWLINHSAGTVVLSAEMENLLRNRGAKVFTIPTMSSLPPVDEHLINTDKCAAYAVFNTHKRKNAPLLEKLQQFCTNTLQMNFDFKTGMKILTEKEYIHELDTHEVYVCTSIQEGGPLPAMDAMMRGAIVVTTPVGQMPEIITHGESGFICNSEDEFKQTLKFLWECDKKQLHTYRLASLRAILAKRQRSNIQKRVQSFLSQLS